MGGPRLGIESAANSWVFTLLLSTIAVLGSSSVVSAQGPSTAAAQPDVFRVYVGTYTGSGVKDKSQGIYLMDLDVRTGTLSPPRVAASSTDPSFLAIHPNQKYLYSVNELNEFKGRRGGAVSAFSIDPASGKLSLLNAQSSVGDGPCHLVVDRLGKNVLVANYGSGSVACLPIDADGRIRRASSFIQHKGSGANPQRQNSPHAHSINLDAAGRFAVAADLGLDKVFIYSLDAAHGKLTPNQPAFTTVAPGSGPRHFAFHPDGRFGYVISEMANTMTAFAYDADKGALTKIQTISTLPEDFTGKSYTAEVRVHPSGKFLYGSNRGHNSVAIFAIDPSTGKLTTVGYEPTQGKSPRNFAIDPTGQYLLAENQDSDTIVVFRIDPQTGALRPTGQTVVLPKPVCIKMIPKSATAAR